MPPGHADPDAEAAAPPPPHRRRAAVGSGAASTCCRACSRWATCSAATPASSTRCAASSPPRRRSSASRWSLDMLDGRIARMTGTTSDFGIELDSLADVISFGMAPAILSFSWGLQPLGRLGWAVGFLFVAAAAVRLARFNIQAGSQDKRYFVGMPSPAAAGVPGGHRLRLSVGASDLHRGAAGARDGHRAGAADGQHDPLPQLQDHRSRGAAQLSGAVAGGGRLAAARRAAGAGARRAGLRLPAVGVRRNWRGTGSAGGHGRRTKTARRPICRRADTEGHEVRSADESTRSAASAPPSSRGRVRW